MLRKWLWMFLASLALVFFSGCYQIIRPPIKPPRLGTEKVFQKNYQIGQMQTAYVGQPIVKLKDYQIERYGLNNMMASEDFVISEGSTTLISGNKNTSYPISGETTINNETYVTLDILGHRGVLALIRKDGTVYNKLLGKFKQGYILVGRSVTVSPPNLKFTPLIEETIYTKAGYLNYELIYTGTDGKSLSITYREYTADDLARPAFFQNLVYESSNRRIRFKDIVIEIHEATNEKIVYTVISDGLSK